MIFAAKSGALLATAGLFSGNCDQAHEARSIPVDNVERVRKDRTLSLPGGMQMRRFSLVFAAVAFAVLTLTISIAQATPSIPIPPP